MADLRCYAGKCTRGISVACLSILSGILAPLIFLLLMVAVESFQPGYNPIQDTISKLVLGLRGWVQTLSFLLFGFLFTVFTLRLYNATLKTTASLFGTAFFLFSGLAFFILAAFPVSSDAARRTLAGSIHTWAASSAALFFILGCFTFALQFARDRRWDRYRLFTVFIAGLSLGFSVLWKIAPVHWALSGLFERLAVLPAFVWIEVVSIKLFRNCFGK